MGIARVPDPRVAGLSRIFEPKKSTLATVEYVDVPGVAKGEGTALVDLPALRGVDAFVHVVRAFESDTVPHPEGSVDPARDAAMLELELVLADLSTVERRLERLEANIKKAHKAEDVTEKALFLRLKEALEAERPAAGGAAHRRGAPPPARLRAPEREAAPRRRQRGRGRSARRRRAPRGDGPRRPRPPPERRRLRGLGADRGGDGRSACRGRAGLPRGPRPRRAGARPRHPLDVRAARPHLVPHRRRGRVPRLDDPPRHEGAAGGRGDPLRHRAGLHPRPGRAVRGAPSRRARSPPAGTGARCASRGASTRCATAT